MKKIPIIIVLLVAGAIALFMTAADQISSYATFSTAASVSGKVKVIGTLALDKEMVYNPEKDPNYFSFYANDEDGRQSKVVFLGEKPQDFERSDQVVMTGKYKDGVFVASDMLTKCPSKYKDEEVFVRSNAKEE